MPSAVAAIIVVLGFALIFLGLPATVIAFIVKWIKEARGVDTTKVTKLLHILKIMITALLIPFILAIMIGLNLSVKSYIVFALFIALTGLLKYYFGKKKSALAMRGDSYGKYGRNSSAISNLSFMMKVLLVGLLLAVYFIKNHDPVDVSALNRNITLCNETTKDTADKSIEACTMLINHNASQIKKTYPDEPVYVKRSLAYYFKNMPEQAMADLNHVLSINPNSLGALMIRSTLYIAEARYVEAIADNDKALQANPNLDKEMVGIFRGFRGIAKFYSASPEAAIDDLRAAIRNNTDRDLVGSWILWLHIARLRSGQEDNDLEISGSLVPEGKWPTPLIELYKGKTTVEDVFAKAKASAPDKLADNICDANFYSAEFYLLQGMKEKARPLFQAAIDTCPKIDLELAMAKAELKALK